jgi:hypothetical protein
MAPLICLKMKSFYRYQDYGAIDLPEIKSFYNNPDHGVAVLPENGQLLQISGSLRH